MNEVIGEDDRFKDDVQFSFDSLNRKVTGYKTAPNCIFLTSGKWSGSLPILGFQALLSLREKQIWSKGLTIFMSTVTLYKQFVGDALVPLLRIVPVEGDDGQRVSKSFERPHYLPVSRREFETIEVNIKHDTGESVPFELGKVLLTLHFRQSRPVNF